LQSPIRARGGFDPRAFTADREGRVGAHGVVDRRGDHFAAHRHGGHRAEQGQAAREILGAVERVDDEREDCVIDGFEQSRIARAGLLADQHGLGMARAQGREHRRLAGLVGIGHDVEGRGLAPAVDGVERAEARHDFLARGVGEKRSEEREVVGGERRSGHARYRRSGLAGG